LLAEHYQLRHDSKIHFHHLLEHHVVGHHEVCAMRTTFQPCHIQDNNVRDFMYQDIGVPIPEQVAFPACL